MGNLCTTTDSVCDSDDYEFEKAAAEEVVESFCEKTVITATSQSSLPSLLLNRNPTEMYGERVELLGKFGTVAEFFAGTVCPDCCWCAFALSSKHMKTEQLLEFFDCCLNYFSQTTSPSLRLWAERQTNDIYYEFVIKTFGKAKNYLNRREFWYVADKMQSRYETEKTVSVAAAEEINIVWHRKQSLIPGFFLDKNHDHQDSIIFKLFSSNGRILTSEEMHNLVYHSILFFSVEQFTIIQDLTDVWDVVFEVCRDIMNGEDLEAIDFNRFRAAGRELRDVFHQLSTLQEERSSRQPSSHGGKSFSTFSSVSRRMSCDYVDEVSVREDN